MVGEESVQRLGDAIEQEIERGGRCDGGEWGMEVASNRDQQRRDREPIKGADERPEVEQARPGLEPRLWDRDGLQSPKRESDRSRRDGSRTVTRLGRRTRRVATTMATLRKAIMPRKVPL